jgi:TatD DNase family protein
MARCDADGVEHMLCVSIDLEAWPTMRALIEPFPQVSVSVGVHPMAEIDHSPDRERLCELARDERVVAIGETGLDYYYAKGDVGWQQQRFRVHVAAAVETGLPLIIHTRDAGDDTLRILREEGAQACGGVIHCFTETADFAAAALELGFMISFSGIVTFSNAQALRDVAASVPEDRLLIETDSPYLAPVPHRGKQNWPALVSHVAATVAEVRGTTVEHVAKVSAANYYRLFGRH